MPSFVLLKQNTTLILLFITLSSLWTFALFKFEVSSVQELMYVQVIMVIEINNKDYIINNKIYFKEH